MFIRYKKKVKTKKTNETKILLNTNFISGKPPPKLERHYTFKLESVMVQYMFFFNKVSCRYKFESL